MSRLTIFLARLIGLYTIIVGLAIGLRKEQSIATINAVVHAPEPLLVLGLIALVAGLAMVLRHNVWSGGAVPVVVTLVGWTIFLRAVLLLFLSSETVANLLAAVDFAGLFYVYIGGIIAIGLWLTYAGFTAKAAAGSTER